MKIIFISLFLISPFLGANQNPRLGQDEATYQAEGRMLLFQVRPGDKFMRVYLVGKEAAKVDLTENAKLVNVTIFQKGKKEKVPFKSFENYYEFESIPQKGPYELEMEATQGGRPDKVRMSIKP